MIPTDESDREPSVSTGATARLAFAALETSSVGSESEGTTSKAQPPTVPPHLRQGQTFENEDNALFEIREYDGKGGGFFCVSEQDINRNVPIAPPSVSTGVEKYDLAADDADDEMPDAEEEDEDAHIGPSLEDQPLDQHADGAPVQVTCLRCHQTIEPPRTPLAPDVSLTS